jgi:hypothetical protein
MMRPEHKTLGRTHYEIAIDRTRITKHLNALTIDGSRDSQYLD